MRAEFADTPRCEGIFGPEIVLNPVSGRSCLRLQDGSVVGHAPEMPWTNAFLVWTSRWIVVVSEGVRKENLARVARGLREFLEDGDVPVVVSLGSPKGLASARVISDGSVAHDERELARAEGYVLVQAAWSEASAIDVELNGRRFSFRVEFHPDARGRFIPKLE